MQVNALNTGFRGGLIVLNPNSCSFTYEIRGEGYDFQRVSSCIYSKTYGMQRVSTGQHSFS